jgi:hypothetical protein
LRTRAQVHWLLQTVALLQTVVWIGAWLSAAAFAQTPAAPASPAQAKPTRVALVIGNAAYKDAPLLNPVNDAVDIAKLLEKAGFHVVLRQNAGLRDMHLALREFGDKLGRDSLGVFYFSGHGMQVRGRNFLVPVDADISREDEVAFSAFDVQAALEKMDSARNHTNLIILDACRNNPFPGKFKLANAGLAQIDAPPGSVIAFATAPGSTAADGFGRNGLYTKHLLAQLSKEGVRIEEAFKLVRAAVRKESAGLQTPWESTSLEGELYLAGAPKPKPAPAVAAKAPPSAPRAKPTQIGAAPQFVVGDQWEMRVTDHQKRGARMVTRRVTGITGDEVEHTGAFVTDLSGNTLRQQAGDKQRTFTPSSMLYVFPLSPGLSWGGRFVDETPDVVSEVDVKIRAVGEEEIEVPAGRFRAIKVERAGEWKVSKSGNTGRSVWTYWYSSQAKIFLKYEWTNTTSDGKVINRESMEMVSFSVK